MGRWGSIKHKKAASDAKRGVQMAKASREIMSAAKQGGGDVNFNVRLRTAVERAKAIGLPNAKIDNAIEKGTGSGSGDDLTELTYEGYGPGGVAIFIEAATDNKNRTAGDIRSYFNKNEGNLGQDGCVAYLFEELGLITLPKGKGLTFETVMEGAIEAGATDVKDEDEAYQILCAPTDLNEVTRALEAQGLPVESAELTRWATTETDVTDESVAKPLLKLLEALDDHPDVNKVVTNANIDPGFFGED